MTSGNERAMYAHALRCGYLEDELTRQSTTASLTKLGAAIDVTTPCRFQEQILGLWSRELEKNFQIFGCPLRDGYYQAGRILYWTSMIDGFFVFPDPSSPNRTVNARSNY
jgi:hypothetical protein